MGNKSSISCDKYQDMIYNYFSDNLSEEQIEKLEDHISSCLICKNEFEQVRALLSSAEQFEDQPLPVGFTTSLHTKLIEASEEIQDRRAHRFKYFCKDFITDGKWKVAAPAVVAVALLVGVFSSGLFQDFIHTNDDIVTDNIQTGQKGDHSNAFNDDFGLDRNSKETTSPRTTSRPKASASPTAKASSPKSTAKATSKATSKASNSTGLNARATATAKTENGTTKKATATATKKPTTAPTAQKNYPEIEFNDSASQASVNGGSEQDISVNENYMEQPAPRLADERGAIEEESAPAMQQSDSVKNSITGGSGGGSAPMYSVDGNADTDISHESYFDGAQVDGLCSVYYVHHDNPELLIKEYGFSNYSIDHDNDYHVIMTNKDFIDFVDYADKHQLKVQWLNDGDNGMVDLIITKAEIKNEETTID